MGEVIETCQTESRVNPVARLEAVGPDVWRRCRHDLGSTPRRPVKSPACSSLAKGTHDSQKALPTNLADLDTSQRKKFSQEKAGTQSPQRCAACAHLPSRTWFALNGCGSWARHQTAGDKLSVGTVVAGRELRVLHEESCYFGVE